MTKTEFIKLCEEDNASLHDINYEAIINYFKEYIPSDADIDSSKSVGGMYNHMYTYASKHKKYNSCCIDPGTFKKIMDDYLDIKVKEKTETKDVSLEDFFI